MVKIISIRASDGGGAMRIDLRREDQEKNETFYILASHFRDHDLKKGEYPNEAYDVIVRLDGICRGVKSGRRILGYGANSSSALRMKLIGKGIRPEYADEAINILSSEIGLDESRDAMRLCELQLEKKIGARRIISYLRGRGYSDESLTGVREYLSGVDFAPICRESAIRRYKEIPRDLDQKKKCIDYLLRQGFTYSDIKRAFE